MDPVPTTATCHTAGHQGARTVNADAVASAHGVVALADGVGDSAAAVRAALTAVTAAVSVPLVAGPSAALAAAQSAVLADPGAGDAVLVVAQHFPGGYRIGWVGDVRAYTWDGVTLRQLTSDHTLAQYFRDHGEPATPRMEHLVTASVRTASPSRYGYVEAPGRLLLTTDGVHKTLSHEAMTEIMRTSANPAQALVRATAAAGGKDNATAVVVDQEHTRPAMPLPTRPIPAAA